MKWEDELERLAREREQAYQLSLSEMILDNPGALRRQLRHYLAEQTNRRKLKRTYECPRLDIHPEGVNELVCENVEFHSESRLNFNIRMVHERVGWLVKQFKFDLHLRGRDINMLRIHLNQTVGYDPLRVPRCHFHIGDSEAHIPFPIMSPRLMLHLICEHIEPDLGLKPTT